MATAIVTGASTGIGRDLALLCANAGYDLVLVARNQAQLSQLASEIKGGRRVRILAKDLSRPEAPDEIYAEIKGEDIHILINNAGVGLRGHFAELGVAAQMSMLQLNVNALTHLTRLFLPGMIERRSGRVMNVASTAAFQAGPLMAVYYASKAYVLSLSEALHNEVRDRGVSVTALCPGPTITEFGRRARMEKTKLFSSSNRMDSATVARIGFDAMMQGKPLVIAGTLNRMIAFGTRFAPRQFTASMARSLQEETD
jgi:short-subunit dehydrogenase